MTWIGDRRGVRNIVVVLAVVTCVLVAARFSFGAGEPANTREVVLVLRDMAFYVDGQRDANPTLHFKAGETVRLVLRNDEPGMTHQFAVRDWSLASRTLLGPGMDVVTFTAPNRPGRYKYVCHPHSAMMHGSIEIE